WGPVGEEPEELAVFRGHPGVVRQVLFPPDGKTLVSVCDRQRIILWDLATVAKVRDWQMPRLNASSFAFTFDGRYVAMGLNDGSVYVFRLYPKKGHGSHDSSH